MKDKVIVITGASSGIGAALADVCAARGARLVLAARTTPVRAGATCLSADVSKRADNERIRDAALAAHGAIDVWVANAGRGITRAVADLTDEDIDDMMQTNFKSVVYGIQAVLPHWKERQRGHYIAVSSMLGRIPMTSIRSAYSASKAAVNSIMTSLRLELADFPHIHASTFMPGVVATDFGKNARHGGPDSRALPMSQPVEDVAERLAALIEQPRAEAYSRPELQALAARYFAADDVAPRGAVRTACHPELTDRAPVARQPALRGATRRWRGTAAARARRMTKIDSGELALVVGAGVFDSVDNGIAKVAPGWKDKSCSSRAQWVGWGVGTALGAASWATWPVFGPAGQAVVGPVNGLVGTYAVSKYIDNCERQKAR